MARRGHLWTQQQLQHLDETEDSSDGYTSYADETADQSTDADQEGGGGAIIGKNCYRNNFSGMYQTESGLVGRLNPDLHFIHEGKCTFEGKMACIDDAVEPGDEDYCNSHQSMSGNQGTGDDQYTAADTSADDASYAYSDPSSTGDTSDDSEYA